ncbi:MAG TPA: phosphatase PAP2 family protein [Gaiellaceae bacterium]|nr:phosphatase PAP2 family protein [Gaiellaceae bacterium]
MLRARRSGKLSDHGAERWIVEHRVDALDDVFVWLSRIGQTGAVWIAIALVLALLRRRPAILWTIPLVWAADLVAYGIKVAVGRPRPHLGHALLAVPYDGSFPSGHTTTSFAGATLLAWFAPRLAPGLYLLAAAIGFSRLYVGVHWPYDVLAGAALGTLLGLAAVTSLRMRARSRRRSRAGRRRG